jgi:type IV pilus assembly protein PilA
MYGVSKQTQRIGSNRTSEPGGGSDGFRGRRVGFSLIELMLVVAIIGILASVAVPTFISYQLRSKSAEASTNIGAIQRSLEAYYAEYNIYMSAMPPTPNAVGSTTRPWGLAASDSHGFNKIGFVPEGKVFFQYGVTSDGGTSYTIGARSDLDADGAFNTWGYVNPADGTVIGVVGPFATCAPTGVLDAGSMLPNRLQQIGPCDVASSAREY